MRRWPDAPAVPVPRPACADLRTPLRCLAGVPIILFPYGQEPLLYRYLVTDVLGRARVAPSIAFEATTLESACSAVAARLGVAFVGESLARIFAIPGVAYRPFAAPPPMSKLGVAWRQDATSNTVRWFLEILDELAVGGRNGNAHRTPTRAPALAVGPGRSPGLSWPDGNAG